MSAFLGSETANSTDNEAIRRLKLEVRALSQKCKFLAQGMKSFRPSRCFSSLEPSLPITAKDFADQVAQLYVTRFESAFRILHIPSFWTEYEEYWRNPALVTSVLQLKIQLVIAVGSSLNRDSRDTAEVLSAACQWI
jgi:hypothetical protein